jgi:oxygen-independent coproporphyrinogen-3 oxidase
LHLGGGTPTFFSPDNLRKLLKPILADATIHDQHEFSFEGHPNNTTAEHLQALYDLGFRRVSYGVQDNDPEVQRIINRIQPLENVQRATETARSIGYTSVNFDLIYGLPKQTLQSITRTINEVITLRPDRIAFYSYAHVPWTSRGQRLFDENDLPGAAEKLALYLAGKQLLTDNGYHDIGMDHFALATDDLYTALQEGRLHRNFMGYTTQQTEILLGLGVSAISTTPGAFAQNEKTLHNYYEFINTDTMPVQKGLFTTNEDCRYGRHILDLICTGHTELDDMNDATICEYVLPVLADLQADGLVTVNGADIQVTAAGKPFIRNICSAFDLYIARNRAGQQKKTFSNAV